MLATFLEASHVGFRLFNSASVARPRLCDDVNADAWKLPQLLGDTGDPEQRSFSVGIQIDQHIDVARQQSSRLGRPMQVLAARSAPKVRVMLSCFLDTLT